MIEQNKYPRFIQSQPCGIDKFEGGSQNRLASAISSYMQMVDVSDKSDSKDNLPRIIGLEGGWGVGKSNVIKMLGFKLPETYYTFEYDAWGHQEDLQRRSILEMLTTQLIDDSILTGNTTVNVKGGIPKKVSWNEKLKLLLARKSEVITEKYPKLNISIVVSALVAISTPIFTLIAFLVQPEEPTWWSILLSILIAITPILFAIIAWVCAYRKNKKYKNLGYLFAIYTDKIENDIIYETISEEEPTVVEFKSWMKDISDFLGTKSKKLVIVFDNMDRLPDKKVKELWSSIHTFFADTGFENIWVIIPYDLIHLSSAFGEKENNSNLELAKHFIHKTFPIVYAVPPPVITDLKNIFNNLFSDAFGNHEINNKDKINRIFRLERPNATVREVIYFINELVTLKSIWNNEIELKYIALFALKKDEILSDPVNQVLSGDYQSIYIKQALGNDELVQESIAALTFGVEISHAKQIPLKKYILNCLNNKDGYDINKYLLVNNHFTSILDDSIRDADIVQIDTLINVMSNLKLDEISEINRKTIDSLWIFLSNQKMESQVSTMNFDDVYKKMFLNTHQDDMHIKIIKYLCNGFQTFTEFKGREYYKAIRDLEVFLEQSQIKLPLELKEIEKSPEVFIDYVNASEVNYKKYRLKTRSDYLNKYYANLLPENLGNVKALSFLKSDEEYNFTEFIKVLEEYIDSGKVTANNFKSIFEAYKNLSDSTPLRAKLSSDVIQNLFNSFSGHTAQQEYLELIAMRIAVGTSQAILDSVQLEYVANNIEYYSDYGDLMVSCLNINNAALNQVLKYMTLRKLGNNIDLGIILKHFFQIKEKIDVTEESLIEALDQ